MSYIAAGLFFTWVRFAAGRDEKFSSGVYFLLLSAVFLGILSAANLLVSVLPKRYTAFDVTDAGLYSIGDDPYYALGIHGLRVVAVQNNGPIV